MRDSKTIPGLETYANNAFRILGLPAEATQAQVRSAGEALLRKLKLGSSPATDWDLPVLGPLVRTERNIRDAMARLRHPTNRLRERLFWPHAVPAGDIGLLLSASSQDLERIASSRSDTEWVRDAHNRAILLHIAILASDPEARQLKRWDAAHLAWEAALSSDETWALQFEAEVDGGFEPGATTNEIHELRERAWEVVCEPLLKFARDAVARGDLASTNRVLTVLRSAQIPSQILAGLEVDILGPVENALEHACKEVRGGLSESVIREDDHASRNRTACDQAYQRYRTEIFPGLERLVHAAGNNSERACSGKEITALLLHSIAIDYTWGNAFWRSKELLEEALGLVHEGAAATRIEAELLKVRPQAEQERLEETLAPIMAVCAEASEHAKRGVAASDVAAEKRGALLESVDLIERKALPVVHALRERSGTSDLNHETATRIVAQALRALAVQLHNDAEAYADALHVLDRARTLCPNGELGAKLDEERVTVAANAEAVRAARRKKWTNLALWAGIIAAVVLYSVFTENRPRRSAPPTRTVPSSGDSSRLKSQIEIGRLRISSLEAELETIATRVERYAREIATYKQSIDEYERLARVGLRFSESAYRDAIEEHNRLVQLHNRDLETNQNKYAEYEHLLTEDKRMVAEYNRLVGRR